jgi:hypothetical protein
MTNYYKKFMNQSGINQKNKNTPRGGYLGFSFSPSSYAPKNPPPRGSDPHPEPEPIVMNFLCIVII